MIYRLIGWFLRKQRIKKNYTLRRFCHEFSLNASTISRIERGYYFKIAPEYKHRKERIARYVGEEPKMEVCDIEEIEK